MGLPRALSLAAVERVRPRNGDRQNRAVAVAAGVGFIAINIAIFLLPIPYAVFGAWAYLGVFLITLISNAAMVVPIPYVPVIVHVMSTAELLALTVLAAALGSAIGESTGWLVGRAERTLIADHPLYARLQRLASSPWRSGLFVFAVAAPPNPVFDLAGFAAGALGMPYRTFFVAVLAGRTLRFAALALGVVALGL
ncbi:MAG TPA: VTT domain-containing protein [Candidatus Limnocylindria bacterium]|nr:VTT domain-containing protein [Candidatus Limnocylindria bacterium]